MKKAIVLLAIVFLVGCASEQRRWYNRLYAVDAGRITDSAMWDISADTNMVIAIERSAAASTRVTKDYTDLDSVRAYEIKNGIQEFSFGARRTYSYENIHIDTAAYTDSGHVVADTSY